MKSYDDFRSELKSAYPITHWELKLPIAVNLEKFDIDYEKLIKYANDEINEIQNKQKSFDDEKEEI